MSLSLPWPVPGRLPEGVVRTHPEDFRVTERLAFEPCGHGEHLYLRFRKRGLSTPEAVRRLALALGTDPRQASWAGLKDRHAVTEQWASFLGVSPQRAERITLPDIDVLEAVPHTRKLRGSRLRANHFEIRLRGAAAEPEHAETLRARWDALVREGVPNYFGRQRFGRRGDNAERALAWLRGERPPPRSRFERKMLPSALQAELFNRLLALRVRERCHHRALPGDILLLSRKPATRPRLLRRGEEAGTPEDAGPSGPLYGPRMPWPEGRPGAWERQVLAEASLQLEDFRRFGRMARGGRRALVMPLREPDVVWEPGAVCLRFVLPSGSYATVVLAALLGTEPHDAAVAVHAEGC